MDNKETESKLPKGLVKADLSHLSEEQIKKLKEWLRDEPPSGVFAFSPRISGESKKLT